MWLPGVENLSISCQRFQLCTVPRSALKNLLFHTHEIHCLWQWLEWAISGGRCICVPRFLHGCESAMWQMGCNMAYLCPDRCGTAHHREPEEGLKSSITPMANPPTLPTSKLFWGAKDRNGQRITGKLDVARLLQVIIKSSTIEVFHLLRWALSITALQSASLKPVPTWACHGLLHRRTFPPLRGQPGWEKLGILHGPARGCV